MSSEGAMVATLAWNSVRHIETWFGIMGLGGWRGQGSGSSSW